MTRRTLAYEIRASAGRRAENRGCPSPCESLRELDQAGLDPGLAVFERLAAERISATEEGAADAAGDAVVVARSGWVNELVARCGHGCSVA